jgi:hypothetical protein
MQRLTLGTCGLAPGYYDLQLLFQDGGASQSFRIQLT